MINFLLYGFGGYGQLLASLMFSDNHEIRIGVFDDQTPKYLPDYVNYLGSYQKDIYSDLPIIIAIGNNQLRADISVSIRHSLGTYIHKSAFISEMNNIESGTVILQNAVIQHGSKIHKHCIIQPNVVVDHDVTIHEFSHIYPNSYVGSNSILAPKTLLNANSSIARNTNFTF